MSSTYYFEVAVPREIEGGPREELYARLWRDLPGLAGVHEGTALSEDSPEGGRDAWTLDSGEAPRERDWVSDQAVENARFYFLNSEDAEKARSTLLSLNPGPVVEEKPQDWDANWKASFQGAFVAPFWNVIPPWVNAPVEGRTLRLNPGAGFGTGTHETTQLCLEALSAFELRDKQVLDFGSGSGILSIACGLLGAARVDGVEIDPLAIENAEANLALNPIRGEVKFSAALTSPSVAYDLVIANILKSVLLEVAPLLCARLKSGAPLVLSGLVEPDVAPVLERYLMFMPGRQASVRAKNEWRSIVFSKN